MLTLEKITAAAQELPAEFSIDQLVAKLRYQEQSELFEMAAKKWAAEHQASFSAGSAQQQAASAEPAQQPAPVPALPSAPPRPTNLTPEQTAEWDYYTSPAARALYQKFPVSSGLEELRGIIKLAEEDRYKSYK